MHGITKLHKWACDRLSVSACDIAIRDPCQSRDGTTPLKARCVPGCVCVRLSVCGELVSPEVTVCTMALLPQITEDEVLKYLDTTEMLTALDTALGEFSRGEESGVRQPVRSSIIIPESNGWVRVAGARPHFTSAEWSTPCFIIMYAATLHNQYLNIYRLSTSYTVRFDTPCVSHVAYYQCMSHVAQMTSGSVQILVVW